MLFTKNCENAIHCWQKKDAVNLLSSNSRSPAVLLHPFSRLLRAAAVAPCLLSELEVSGVRLSWAPAFNRNCRCHITAENKTHNFISIRHSFILAEACSCHIPLLTRPNGSDTHKDSEMQHFQDHIIPPLSQNYLNWDKWRLILFHVFGVTYSYGTMVIYISDCWANRIRSNVSSYWNFDLALSRSFRSIACRCHWLTGSWLENRPQDRVKLQDVSKTDGLKFRVKIWAIQFSQPRLANPATQFSQCSGIWCNQHFTLLLGLGSFEAC